VRYVADRGDKAAKQVTVTGRLSLTRTAGGWKIREKRVDLLGASRPLPVVQLFV